MLSEFDQQQRRMFVKCAFWLYEIDVWSDCVIVRIILSIFKSLDLSSQFFDDWSHVLGDGIFQVVFLMIGVMFWMMGYFKSFFG